MIIQIINEDLANALAIPPKTNYEILSRNNVPLEKEWRNRLADSETDGCIQVITASKKKVKSDGK